MCRVYNTFCPKNLVHKQPRKIRTRHIRQGGHSLGKYSPTTSPSWWSQSRKVQPHHIGHGGYSLGKYGPASSVPWSLQSRNIWTRFIRHGGHSQGNYGPPSSVTMGNSLYPFHDKSQKNVHAPQSRKILSLFPQSGKELIFTGFYWSAWSCVHDPRKLYTVYIP